MAWTTKSFTATAFVSSDQLGYFRGMDRWVNGPASPRSLAIETILRTLDRIVFKLEPWFTATKLGLHLYRAGSDRRCSSVWRNPLLSRDAPLEDEELYTVNGPASSHLLGFLPAVPTLPAESTSYRLTGSSTN